MSKTFAVSDVSSHDGKKDSSIYIIVDENVYDLTGISFFSIRSCLFILYITILSAYPYRRRSSAID